jgi:hypothetical protein
MASDSATKSFWIVWNGARNEGFITDCREDAEATVSGEQTWLHGYPSSSTVGDAFRETYEDETLSIERVELAEALIADAPAVERTQ